MCNVKNPATASSTSHPNAVRPVLKWTTRVEGKTCKLYMDNIYMDNFDAPTKGTSNPLVNCYVDICICAEYV